MSFSDDDEGEILPEWVTNYFFMDKNNVPISFAVLPFQSGSYGSPVASAGTESHIYMIGDVEGEPQKVYKPVNAWKLELSDVTPVVLVQTKGCGHWIKLRKPSKSFKDMVRTVLVTVHCLHYLKWNGGVSERVLWENLSRVFSSYEAMPSKSDILDQMVLVRMVVDRDETLANSEFILEILGKSRNWKNSGELKLLFQDKLDQVAPDQESVVDEDAIINEITRSADEVSDDESMLYDSVCAICDNGGEILCCEGRCLRSFHPTKESGSDTFCSSLGYTKTQVNEIQIFLCLNCLYEQHQCFACGKLGSSNRASGAEVFPCVSATCGYFYHPSCVARLLFPKNETDAAEYQKKIVDGESFTCPIHKCHVCEKGENKKVFDWQFAICRRCPRAYHRKCLPKEHEIDKDLGTPIRNHIIFPCMQEEKYIPSDLQSNGGENVVEKTTSAHYIRERPVVKKSSSKERYIRIPTSEFCKKASTSNTLKRKVSLKLVSEAPNMHYSPLDNLMPLRKKKAGSHLIQSKQKLVHRHDSVSPPTSVMKRPKYSLPQVDIERKIFDLVEKVSSSITLEDIVGRHTIPSTHSSAAKHFHKTITMGKLEGSIEAVRSALKKLKKGGSTEDAMSICPPEMLKHIVNWRMKLGVYLAPFLHGKRYTSYGRHFTKSGKLKEIVDKLHWYVENDDMFEADRMVSAWPRITIVDRQPPPSSMWPNHPVLPITETQTSLYSSSRFISTRKISHSI
ncbi:hypothetical protein QJS10_CPB17g02650 [Acorus calamus]|uniref:Zinc finger PHD-type domain-containing protein n=1 Tax=Acorus calamus TaxID=4465 RepID=A0AAV9CS22_ACOCL|nr:hypothetical protein QJS10_CPB17g02650 [Acorus calamus]